jgi:hypothetical protein
MNTPETLPVGFALPKEEKDQLAEIDRLAEIMHATGQVVIGEKEVFAGYGNMDNHNFRPIYESEPVYGYGYIHSEEERTRARNAITFIYETTTFETVKQRAAEELGLNCMANRHPVLFAALLLLVLSILLAAVCFVGWIGLRALLPLCN